MLKSVGATGRGRSNRPETRPGIKPSKRGCKPEPPSSKGNPHPLGQ